MSSAGGSLASWFAAEPMAAAAMAIAVFLLLVAGLARVTDGAATPSARAWRLLVVLGRALGFILLLWCGHMLLYSSNASFGVLLRNLISGGEEGRKRQAALLTNWGGNLIQSELVVKHSVQEEYIEEIPQADKKPTLYLHKTRIVPLEQESITGFQGQVRLHKVDSQQATFECFAVYHYKVVNSADVETTTEFRFPLPSMRFHRSVFVKFDGKAQDWSLEPGELHWTVRMLPHQQSSVEIDLETRGAVQFVYETPQRVIRDYELSITTDTDYLRYDVSPQSNAIHFTRSGSGRPNGLVLDWKIDQAIMAPRVTVQFGQRSQSVFSTAPQEIVSYAARALVLLLSLVVITLVICGVEVRPGRLALMAALFCAQYLALMAVYPYVGNYVWPVPLFSLLAMALAFPLLRGIPRLPLALVLVLIMLFAAAYPFASLLPGERERIAVDGGVQAGMILYVFGLTLYTRVRAVRA